MDVILKPVLAGGIIIGYKYWMDRSYDKNINKHLYSGAVGAGAVFASSYLSQFYEIPMNNEKVEAILNISLKPAVSGVLYGVGEKYLLDSNDSFIKNTLVGAGACAVSGFIATPVSKYF